MNYDWGKYLDFAEQLGKDTDYDSETRARIMISRAYYAAYHFAKKFCEMKSINISAIGASHEKLIEALKGISGCEKLGNQLDDFKKKRHKVDYNNKWIFGLNKSSFAVQFVKRVRQFIDALNLLMAL